MSRATQQTEQTNTSKYDYQQQSPIFMESDENETTDNCMKRMMIGGKNVISDFGYASSRGARHFPIYHNNEHK